MRAATSSRRRVEGLLQCLSFTPLHQRFFIDITRGIVLKTSPKGVSRSKVAMYDQRGLLASFR